MMEGSPSAAAATAVEAAATTPAVATTPTKSTTNGRRKKRKPKITAVATVLLWLKRRFAFKFLFFIVISFILSSQVRLLMSTSTSSSSSTPEHPQQEEGIPTAATIIEMNNNNKTNHVLKDETGSRTGFESPVTAIERSRKTLDLRWKDGCMYIPDNQKSQSHLRQNVDAAIPATQPSSSTAERGRRRRQQQQQQQLLPTGIVVTVVIAPKNRQHMLTGRRQICDNLPNQWMYFLHPQQIDMLLLVNPSGGGWNVQYFVECLNLQHHHDDAVRQNNNIASSQPPLQQTWTNLDGSQLETTQYLYQGPAGTSSNGKMTQLPPPIRIYVASTVVKYPLYIQKNPSLLDLRKYGPKGCSGRLTYLNGCRYYTQEMLHLQILQPTVTSLSITTTPSQQPRHMQIQRHDGYDYFIKMDTDIVFRKSPTFFLLQDMINKDAVFAHAGEYHPWGDSSCAPGILDAISNYTQRMTSINPSNDVVSDNKNHRKVPNWNRRMCSLDAPEMSRDADQYYGNFIIGSVRYFTSPAVRSFANFLSNYPSGFFRHKWGDQIFWHYAMGIFLGTAGRTGTTTTTTTSTVTATGNKTNGDSHDFTQYVLDYTDLRCKPNPNCWFSANYVDVFGPNASITCSSDDEIFAHTKLSLLFIHNGGGGGDNGNGNSTTPSVPVWYDDPSKQPLFRSKYPANCGA